MNRGSAGASRAERIPRLAWRPLRPLVVLLLVAPALAVAVSGCTTCEPILEVRHRDVAPDGVDVRPWTAEDGRTWPGVEALMRATGPGDHGHEDWTRQQERAFWQHYGIDLDQPEKELWFVLDGEVYRVRVLTCDLRGEA